MTDIAALKRQLTDAGLTHGPVHDKLEELHLMKTAGIIEVAVRNPNVMEYVRHWEGRAEAAEADRDRLAGELAELQDAGHRALALLRADGRGDTDIAMSLYDALKGATP